jgi:hypothetical protein
MIMFEEYKEKMDWEQTKLRLAKRIDMRKIKNQEFDENGMHYKRMMNTRRNIVCCLQKKIIWIQWALSEKKVVSKVLSWIIE